MSKPERRSRRPRDLVFALITTLVVLFAANELIEWLEDRGALDTHRPDDAVQFLEGELFDVEQGPFYVGSDYASQTMVPARFRVNKGDGWRMFLTGGSFMMGSPYTFQGHGAELPGGIPSWLRLSLTEGSRQAPVEIVNLGVGGQNSFRVSQLVEAVIPYDPDVLVVATCNNEGALPPSTVRQQLHRLGGYRLLTKYLKPGASAEQRSYYTPQDRDSEALARAYRQNIQRIIAAAEASGTPLLLATLPVHRLYRGEEDSSPITEELLLGHGPSDCVMEGIDRIERSLFDDAIEHLKTCEEDLPDALRWTGIALAQLRRGEEARVVLDQSIELRPRNRCRPSFNTIVREEAARSENTHLVDLDAAASAMSTDGLADHHLFLDSCHMNWQGYAAMARVVLDSLREHELLPRGGSKTLDDEVLQDAARRVGLQRIVFTED